MLKFSMLLQAIDRVTAPVKRIQASWKGMGGTIRKTAQDVMTGSRSLEHFERRARRLRGLALGRTFQALGDSARRATQHVTTLIGKLKLAERANRGLKSIAGGIFGKLSGMATGALKWGSAAAVGGGVFAMFDMFTKASDMEQVQVELEAITGSQRAAREEIARLQAMKLSVPLNELTSAYLELRRAGIDPSAQSLRTLADEARYSKKELSDVVLAVKEAKGGDFGGLESMKINTAKKNGRVTFTWLDKQGKRISKTVKDSGVAVEKALNEVFRSRSSGASGRFARTRQGILAGLKTQWDQFLLRVANAGVFDFVKGKLQGLLAQIEQMANDGTLQKWAETISDKLKVAFEWAEKFTSPGGWTNLKTNIEGVGSAIVALANAINSAATAMGYLKDINDGLNEGVGPVSRGKSIMRRWDERANGPQSIPNVPNPAAPSWSPRAPARSPKIGAANDTKVGGLVRIQVEAKPGTSVRTAALQSDNRAVPLQVNLGRVMAAAA